MDVDRGPMRNVKETEIRGENHKKKQQHTQNTTRANGTEKSFSTLNQKEIFFT